MATCGTITVVPAFDPAAVTASCSVGQTEAIPGENVTVPITITNGNDAEAQYEIEVSLGAADSTTITGRVGANGQATEQIAATFDAPGDYSVTIDTTAQRV